jgi:hypothetical protein
MRQFRRPHCGFFANLFMILGTDGDVPSRFVPFYFTVDFLRLRAH